jgi:hypothetical protein
MEDINFKDIRPILLSKDTADVKLILDIIARMDDFHRISVLIYMERIYMYDHKMNKSIGYDEIKHLYYYFWKDGTKNYRKEIGSFGHPFIPSSYNERLEKMLTYLNKHYPGRTLTCLGWE